MGRIEAHFDGEVAIVTGAASGIGLACACALYRAGARVHGFDLDAPDKDDLSEALRAATTPGPRRTQTHAIEDETDEAGIEFRRVDVCDGDAVRAAVGEVLSHEGRIDHLVQAAGIVRDRALWKLEQEDWQAVLDVNLTGSFRVLQKVAVPMREAGRGRVVLVTSINALRGKFGQTAYASSKAGLIGLTRTAARELGAKGITVNAVAPGMIDTPMTLALPAEVREKALEETALGRLGNPRDVVGTVLFLLSDQAAHVTGEVVRVDGGQRS